MIGAREKGQPLARLSPSGDRNKCDDVTSGARIEGHFSGSFVPVQMVETQCSFKTVQYTYILIAPMLLAIPIASKPIGPHPTVKE